MKEPSLALYYCRGGLHHTTKDCASIINQSGDRSLRVSKNVRFFPGDGDGADSSTRLEALAAAVD